MRVNQRQTGEGMGGADRWVRWSGLAALAGTVAFAGATAAEAQEERVRMECRGGQSPCIMVWNLEDGVEMRPRLGVYLSGRMGRAGGVWVTGLTEDGPADRAGIRAGDVIVGIAGHDLAEPVAEEADTVHARRELDESGAMWLTVRRAWSPERRLRSLLAGMEEGDTIEVGIERDGEALTFMVSPEALPSPAPGTATLTMIDSLSFDSLRLRMREAYERQTTRNLRDLTRDLTLRDTNWATLPLRAREADALVVAYGFPRLDLIDLNPELGAYFGTSEGVLVADIEDDSALGLRPGDVVIDVEGRTVDDAAELRRILASYRGDEEIAFSIRRDGEAMTVTGRREGPSPPRPR